MEWCAAPVHPLVQCQQNHPWALRRTPWPASIFRGPQVWTEPSACALRPWTLAFYTECIYIYIYVLYILCIYIHTYTNIYTHYLGIIYIYIYSNACRNTCRVPWTYTSTHRRAYLPPCTQNIRLQKKAHTYMKCYSQEYIVIYCDILWDQRIYFKFVSIDLH